MPASPNLTVTADPDTQRFEAEVDGEPVGYMEYIPLEGKIIATHTEILPEHEGKGLGSQLVRSVVSQLRDEGQLLRPECPYVASWLRRHPDQADIVDRDAPH